MKLQFLSIAEIADSEVEERSVCRLWPTVIQCLYQQLIPHQLPYGIPSLHDQEQEDT